MPRNITRGELLNKKQEPENPIKAHYEFADKRLIVKKETVSCSYPSYYLYIETKSKDSLGNEVWIPYLKTQIPEPEDLYDFSGLGSTNNINEAFSTLVAILLYKRQDLLVDKLEKTNA